MSRPWRGTCAVVLGGTGELGTALVKYLLLRDYTEVVRVGTRAESERPRVYTLAGKLTEAFWPGMYASAGDLLFELPAINERSLYPVLTINAMGRNLINLTEDLTLTEYTEVMKANTWPTVLAAQMLTYLALERPTPVDPPRPTLVSIGSNACEGAGASSLAYVASKHALTGVTRSLARDLQGVVNVLQVNPPKLRDDTGAGMSGYIDRAQAALRGSTVEEEKQRQARSSPSGQETISIERMALLICQLLTAPQDLDHLHGSIVRIGYPS